MPNEPANLGTPDDESASFDQDAFDRAMAQKTPEQESEMIDRLLAIAANGAEVVEEDDDGEGPEDDEEA